MTKKKFVPVIETDIPPPPNKSKKGYADLLRSLPVGGSVWLPTSVISLRAMGRKLFGNNNYAARAEGNEDLEPGARIWRLK